MNIETLLPCDQQFTKNYRDKINLGQNSFSNKKIVFAGLCRNIGSKINDNITKLLSLAQTCKDYKIVIFENDSIDNTKELLVDWTQKNSNIICIFDSNNRPQYGAVKDKDRIIALSEYRNRVKNYIKEHLSDYDFVIVTDMDFLDFSFDGIYNTFGWFANFPDEVDAIAGNSFEYKDIMESGRNSLWNYDSWAFRYNWWNELPKFSSMNYYSMLWFGFWILPVGLDIIPVNSAFGGMAVYKLSQYIQSEYDSFDCEHVTLHYNLKQIIKPKFQLFLNPSQIMLV